MRDTGWLNYIECRMATERYTPEETKIVDSEVVDTDFKTESEIAAVKGISDAVVFNK